MAWKIGESCFSASSQSFLMRLSGCVFATRWSGEIRLSIVACCFSDPRIFPVDHSTGFVSIPSERKSTAC
jgi:hypothetical protein